MDEDSAEKNDAAVAKLKAQLAARQSALSKHLAANRAERSKRGDGSGRPTT